MLIELDDQSYQDLMGLKENNFENLNMPDEKYQLLVKGKFLVNSNETETNKIILANLTKQYDNTRLNLTIAPTRACNFACIYCYEEDRAKISMNQKTITGIEEFLKRYDYVDSINVTWYGGEPTLEIPIMKKLTQSIMPLTKTYCAHLITNGFLLDKIIPYLHELNINAIQITIDGCESTHNKRRPLLKGGKTFGKIMKNIDELIQIDKIKTNIRMNVDESNVDEYADLYNTCMERFSGKVSLYPGFVHLDKDNEGGCKIEDCYNDIRKAQFLKDLFEKHNIYSNDIYPFIQGKGCMVNLLNGLLIGPEGELYKCWHHLGVKDKIVGSIFEKNIFTNIDLVANCMLKQGLFDENCKNCIVFPSCNGGCFDMREKKSNYCIPAKSMLEDFLEIHYEMKTKNSSK
jgi:uncharacterized protein